jgi:hypothetical protein
VGKKDKKNTAEELDLTSGEALAAETAAVSSAKLTAGSAALYGAERRAALRDITEVAGVNDILQGADLVATSEDVALMGAAVASLNEDDLDDTMEIAAISGELGVLADVLATMDMSTMAEFLFDRSERLHDIAVDNLLRFGALRALSEAMDDTSEDLAMMGEDEMMEGEARLEISDALGENAEAMAAAGEELIAQGLATLAAAQAAEDMGGMLEE